MILSIDIPILHRNKQSQLPVALYFSETILSVESLINDTLIHFVKDEWGCFKAKKSYDTDKDYLHCIETQINRMFN